VANRRPKPNTKSMASKTVQELQAEFGWNLRKQRKARRLTIERVAELVDLSSRFVGCDDHFRRLVVDCYESHHRAATAYV